ncbi:N-acetylneuraminate synthase [Carboxylicivirga sp. M1479]|uniref:N-acetylneuraminate synthase n=1 Tax=Carboxylicivirga sp. M1479 TaxID=2594476 RepID=UPI001177CAD9|nr:N-acetylneuraminate synthase [Carboxylicivirga sp. M1479]TRX70543.1 N-acetylneuraminate synthase [Carboxylicivirga sp. M1479]
MQTLIIAEAGVNHNGDIELAKQLVEVAADCGADYVKFQTFKAENLVSKTAEQAEYQKQNTGMVESQYDMLKKLELSATDHQILMEHCKKHGIKFLSTGFDQESLLFLESIGMELWKIPSGELTNLPYLEYMASQAQPLILSTGMASKQEIADAIEVLCSKGKSKEEITVLHCTTEYPTPMGEVNLKAMHDLEKSFACRVGYSDHTKGIEVPIAAVALGATVIEKHFTLDNSLPGPDHKASLEPMEFKDMVKGVRNIERALGTGIKAPTLSELKNKSIARKSIHLQGNLREGHILTADDLEMKRPGDGISPMKMNEVLGKTACRELKAGSMLKWEDLV